MNQKQIQIGGDELMIIAIIIGVLIFLFIADKILNKILHIKKGKISETPGKKIEFWGRTIIWIIILIVLWFAVNTSDILRMFYIMVCAILAIGFQAMMEFI